MSRKMHQAGLNLALEAFWECLPARSAYAKNDSLFLAITLHLFNLREITWCALSQQPAHWNSVWKLFDKPGNGGLFEYYPAIFAGLS